MKKLISAFVILALCGGGAYYYFVYAKPVEKPQIIQAAISRGNITQAVTATGTIEALRTVPVGSQVSGTVSELNVDYNSIVKTGMVLAQIDPTLLQVQVSVQEANIARQQVDIDSQKVQLENDQHNLVRTQQMFDKSLVTQQALEQADLTVKSRVASIASAEKQLVQAQANLDQAKLNVEYCRITSPIDGVVIQRNVDKGQTVQASMTSPQFFLLATDLTHLKLTGVVDEADIGYIRPNQDVTFTVDAYGQQEFTGNVNSVRLNSISQQNVVTYQTVIDVLNPDLKLRPGMTANLKIIIETAPNVTRVPSSALRFRPNNDTYVALGLTPPAAGQRGGAGNAGAGAPGATPATTGAAAPAAPGAAPTDTKTPAATADAGAAKPDAAAPGSGRGGNGQTRQNRQGSGQGFGAQQGGANMTPEQMAAMAQRFGNGRGGRGNGAGRGNRAAANAAPVVPTVDRMGTATKIDELFMPLQRPVAPGSVWIWDEGKRTLTQLRLTLGVTDGQFSELLSGDLQVGQTVVTGIIIPVVKTTTGTNPLMQQNQRGGPGGLQPGNPGGGRGGGGGGGGRGGN